MKENLEPTNAKGQPHGYWERYHYNGELWYKCVYINGKQNGFYEYYWRSGKITKMYYL